jgi:FAD/FMN-containing dehydrogenase
MRRREQWGSTLAPEVAALESAIEGTLVFADSPDYRLVRKPAWAQFEDVRPRAAVLCRVPEDVVETISLARRLGIPTVARSGGHCVAGRSSTTGILIDVGPMNSVSMDDGIATVGAGAQLGEICERLEEFGLTIVGGACPSVGIAGLTLGGGLGILGRRYGLTSDQLVEAQIVLADGRIVDCDEHRNPDLFWALRGAGGGQFGVVTSFRFKTVPADNLTCFKLVWPHTHAAALIESWQGWAPDAADGLAASLLLNASGTLDQPIVTLFGAMRGGEAETANLLDGLVTQVGADPAAAAIEEMSHGAAKRYLGEHAPGVEGQATALSAEPLQPELVFVKSEFFREPLPSDVIAALVDAFGTNGALGQARELDFTPWGGAYNRTPPEATAFVHRSDASSSSMRSCSGALPRGENEMLAANGWRGRGRSSTSRSRRHEDCCFRRAPDRRG